MCAGPAGRNRFGKIERKRGGTLVSVSMAKTLVIVESPTKARTLERILNGGYEVQASYGHVRDLPESADEIPDEIRKKKWGRLGVDTDGDFKPYYVDPERQAQARAGVEGAL